MKLCNKVIALGVVFLCGAAGQAAAQSVALQPAAQQAAVENQQFVDTAQSGAAHSRAVAAMLQSARAEGRIRVIAGLRLTLHPAETLSGAARIAQARALGAAQDRVVARALGNGTPTATVTRFATIPFVSMFVTAGELQRLLADPEVVNIQHDVPLRPTLLESVPRINADDVWAAGIPGTGSAVAILDTGVSKTHPMLAGVVVSEACYSTDAPARRQVSLCPGRVAASTEPGSAANCTGVTGCDHGTHVAGIAAGRPMPGTNETGVAKRARIIGIQVFTLFSDAADCNVGPPCLGAYYTDIAKGLERVYELRNAYRIAAVNLSLGGGYPQNASCDNVQPVLTELVNRLRGVRIATVIASGNSGLDGEISPPSCISSAIAVGSTLDTADEVSFFSNHAPHVRLLAPGSDIRSAVPGGLIQSKNGTSMATPHVAGAFALLRNVYNFATVDDISAALECTGVPVDRAGIVRPRIDVDAARVFLRNPPNTTRLFEFDRVAEAQSWTPLIGAFAVSGGRYRSNRTPDWKISSMANCNENLAIEARMRHVEPDPERTWNGGIFFKAQLNPTTKTFSGYFAGYNDFDGGQVFINRLHHFDLKVLNGGWAYSLCAVKRRIDMNIFHTLRVESVGGRHRVYLDGRFACSVLDRTFGVGKVAIAAYFPNPSTGHSFEVDDILIDPNESIPPPAGSTIGMRAE